jgi:hypothetical protein
LQNKEKIGKLTEYGKKEKIDYLFLKEEVR